MDHTSPRTCDRISWFSGGVSSAVATKLALMKGPVRIIFIDIDDHHPDTHRFIQQCQDWFGVSVERIRSSKYSSVDQVLRSQGYINGPTGAPCTRLLKRRVRQEWEWANPSAKRTYIWGLDSKETERAQRICLANKEFLHEFPLIEKQLDKSNAHKIIQKIGIDRPALYELGFPNNNCIGCVKGGMGYWRLIRDKFPDVFESRVKLESDIGATCIRGRALKDIGNRGRDCKIIIPECGAVCEGINL